MSITIIGGDPRRRPVFHTVTFLGEVDELPALLRAASDWIAARSEELSVQDIVLGSDYTLGAQPPHDYTTLTLYYDHYEEVAV